jgi:ribosomal protein S18 acetylase RimI-like enzyme
MLDYMKVYNAHIIKDTKAIHLYSTGILLEYRGRGIMGKSLRDSFEYFFNNGFNKILLETSDESNIVIYQKLGFKITEVISKKKQSMYFLDLERVNDECI